MANLYRITTSSKGIKKATFVSLLHHADVQQRHKLPATWAPEDTARLVVEVLESDDGRALDLLDLGFNNFGLRGYEAIFARALGSKSTLQELDLQRSDLDGPAAEVLAKRLAKNPPLRKLNLTQSKIDDSGASAIAAALETNTSLEFLDLSGCPFGEGGIEALAGSLIVNRGLVRVHLNDLWRLDDHGAGFIARLVRDNDHITTLELSGNEIKTKAARELAEAHRANPTLKRFRTYLPPPLKKRKKKPKTARKAKTAKAKPAPTAKEASREFPLLYVGHGTARVSDQLHAWVLFDKPPTRAERRALQEAAPDPFTEFVWEKTLLYLATDIDVKYAVQLYDPSHLDWLPEDEAELSSDETIDRIERELMDASRKGPKAPPKSSWEAFDQDIDRWIGDAHRACPVSLFAKDVRITKTHPSQWHAWSAANVFPLLPKIPTKNKYLSGYLIGLLLKHHLAVCPAKELTEAQKRFVLELQADDELFGKALAEILSTYSPAERKRELLELLEHKHPASGSVLLASKIHKLLLDDEVFAAAQRAHCRLPEAWQAVVSTKTGLSAIRNHHHLTHEEKMRRVKPAHFQWAERVLALADPVEAQWIRDELDELR